MEVIIFGGICLIVALAVYVLGWRTARRTYHHRVRTLAEETDALATKAQGDEARFGIDVGKRYATKRMRDTLDDIEREVDP